MVKRYHSAAVQLLNLTRTNQWTDLSLQDTDRVQICVFVFVIDRECCHQTLWNIKSFAIKHWSRNRGKIQIGQNQVFLFRNAMSNWRSRGKVTIIDVISRFPPHHWYCKTNQSFFYVQPVRRSVWQVVQRIGGDQYMSPILQLKWKLYAFLIVDVMDCLYGAKVIFWHT